MNAFFSRAAGRLTILLAAASLTGCYVMPVHPPAPMPSVVHGVPAAPPSPLTFSARLYPANDLAAPYGIVAAVVTNDLNGRGHFSTSIHGESFTGEATRHAKSSSREGLANGVGNRGGFISCRYTMNNPTQGTGTCRLASGAVFSMHVGH
jgi:hypothetical protein